MAYGVESGREPCSLKEREAKKEYHIAAWNHDYRLGILLETQFSVQSPGPSEPRQQGASNAESNQTGVDRRVA